MSIKKVKTNNNLVRWEVYMRLPNLNNKKIRRRFERKIDAQNFVEELKSRNNSSSSSANGISSDVEAVRFNDLVSFWKKYKADEFTEGYHRVIGPALLKADRYFGNRKASQFNAQLLTDYRMALASEGLSRSTQNRYVDIITRILNFCFKRGLINFNPTDGYEKLSEKHDDIDFWNKEEMTKFLKFANVKYPKGSKDRWVYVSYYFALETGLRAREIWALTVNNIVNAQNKVKITKQVTMKGVFTPTKGKDLRFVPFSKSLRKECSLLSSQRSSRAKTFFHSNVGTPVNHDNFAKRKFKVDIAESGVRKIRFHDMRHTAITQMVLQQIPLPIIQKIVGHKSIKTTMKYVHIMGKDIDEIGLSFSLVNISEAV